MKSKILQDLDQLLQNQESCDVVLRVKGQEFPAHRAILTARSPVFASAFRSDMKEKATGIVDIEDCDDSTFPSFLRFLYSGDVQGLSSKNVFSIFFAADKYDVSDLREKCLEFLKENLSVDTFCDTLALALRHSETEMVRSAAEFFVAHVEKITVTVAWQTFAAENPTESKELFIKYVSAVKR